MIGKGVRGDFGEHWKSISHNRQVDPRTWSSPDSRVFSKQVSNPVFWWKLADHKDKVHLACSCGGQQRIRAAQHRSCTRSANWHSPCWLQEVSLKVNQDNAGAL